MTTQRKSSLPDNIKSLLYLALGAAGLFVLLRYVLPLVAPFVAAIILAVVIEPVVRLLAGRFRVPRAAASGICSVLMLGLLGFLIFLLAGRVVSEAGALLVRSPGILEGIASRLGLLTASLDDWLESASPGLGALLLPMLDSLPSELARIAGTVSAGFLSALSSAARRTPELLLFVVTSGLGLYFISSEYPDIASFLRRQIPGRHRERATAIYRDFLSSAGAWLRAQLILTLITFLELLLALSLLRAEYAIIMAAVISIVDLLPILGTGTVLIPWAVSAMLSGDYAFALGLIITYAAVTLLRGLIQAKLVGDQLGLSPLVSLAAMYIGFAAFGVAGMLVLPVAAIMVVQLNERGVLRLWKPSPKQKEEARFADTILE